MGGQREMVGEANHRFANHLMALGAIVQRRARRLRPVLKLVPGEDVESAFTAIQNAIIAIERLHRAMAVNPAERELALAELFKAVLSDFKAIFQDRLTFNVSIPTDLRLDA